MGQGTEPEMFKQFADLLGTEVKDRRLDIPEDFGKGYCIGYDFNQHIRMMILNYELNQELLVENSNVNITSKTILFKFQNIFPIAGLKAKPSVLIATSSLNPDVVIPIHTQTATINIEVDASYLDNLFDRNTRSPVLQSLLQNSQPLLFEAFVFPSVMKVLNEILMKPATEPFTLFLMRIKAEELVCRLLMELENRKAQQLYPLNTRDIQIIFTVKQRLLEHMDKRPSIQELSAFAGMSPTKLKRLFQQIFGDSIVSYYQHFRMEEAARLLMEEKLSVSDVGYKLGFTNLSHFTRVFEDHIGMKPKKYSSQVI
jgi:AraC-like DNA-binding protein